MTKWIYRAVGTVGVAAGGALLLTGGAAQADGIDAPVNDLRGSLDSYFSPIGDLPVGGGLTKDLPSQQLGFLGALPLSPAAGVDPTALEAGPAPMGADLTLVGLGDKKLGTNNVADALDSFGTLTEDPAGAVGGDQLLGGQAPAGSGLPALGELDDPLGGDPVDLGLENQLTDALSEDNLNTIGSDSQMRTLGSTVGVDQLADDDLDSLGGGSGLGDLGRGGLDELTEDPLGAVGKHAAPDPSDLAIAGLKGGDLEQIGQSLVPALIGNALEAEMPPGFLGDLSEGSSLPLVGSLPLAGGIDGGGGPLAGLPLLNALGGGGGQAPTGSPAPASAGTPAQVPAQNRQPAGSSAADNGAGGQRTGHRQWSRSSSERPVAGEDSDFR